MDRIALFGIRIQFIFIWSKFTIRPNTALNIASPQTVLYTQLGEEVHEEGTVEILAELVQHEPGNIVSVRSG